MKQIKLLMFFIKELSIQKYLKYIRQKLIGKSMFYIMCNLDKNSSFYMVLCAMIFYNTTEKQRLRLLFIDKAYGRNCFKKVGKCKELINIIVKTHNEMVRG